MTLDAMHWVWSHSQSKGNARIAVLFVADQVRTSAAEVRLSYPDFMGALNAPKSTVQAAIRAAVKSGELVIVEAGKGSRAALYRLPKAVGYTRPAVAGVPDSGTPRDLAPVPLVPDSGTARDQGVPDSGTPRDLGESAGVPVFGTPGGAGVPESGTHYPTTPSKHEGEPDTPAADGSYGIPDAARPLVDSMTASGVIVRWPFTGTQWFPVLSLIEKCGIPALVAYARRTADRTSVESAKYFMRGWAELPPKPATGTPVHIGRPHLRAVGQSPEERGIF
ncbi:hypothetical protein [Streptomyces sp. KN37]|uniref:hypothetical protein n=1 Tax=Streptomyces sp. KN37 TaxID=3090667 RepID=UPI002A75DC44|nr:hypothetical protein [Streptomyces sp. KN37]WPO73986.1 hypothetical protein R9806_26895 [Streptomyces sp. KN37]